MALDGSLNRHGGQADMETNADERARERAEAVEERMLDMLVAGDGRYVRLCPGCDLLVQFPSDVTEHTRTCELLRARAEAEVDRG